MLQKIIHSQVNINKKNDEGDFKSLVRISKKDKKVAGLRTSVNFEFLC